MPEYQDQYYEQEGYQPLPPAPEETFADVLAQKTPWWLISIGIHAVLFLILWATIQYGYTTEERSISIVQTTQEQEIEPEEPPEEEPEVDEEDKEEIIEQEEMEEEKAEVETDDPYEETKGEEDAMSLHPVPGKYWNNAIGVGGGFGGGRPGRGGRRYRGQKGGRRTFEAVLRALQWLARHQNVDGSWSVRDYINNCGKYGFGGKCDGTPKGFSKFDIGVTGLALLAFLGAGYDQTTRYRDKKTGISFAEVVRKGLNYLVSKQAQDGCIGSKTVDEYMYNHTIAAFALCEAYGMTRSPIYKKPTYRAIEFILNGQNENRAWRYTFKSGDNDSSVTGWAVMVLKSAEMWRHKRDPHYPLLLQKIRRSYKGAKNWYNEMTEMKKEYEKGKCGYTSEAGKIYYYSFYREGPAKNIHYKHQESMTAIGVMARIFIDKNENDPLVHAGAHRLLQSPPKWETPPGYKECPIDFYYWYYASLALFQYGGEATSGPRKKVWDEWNKYLVQALVPTEINNEQSCKHGSWDPIGKWCGAGGRVYATAINALTLEVYYRYPSAFTGIK